jgi:hypothetical protein
LISSIRGWKHKEEGQEDHESNGNYGKGAQVKDEGGLERVPLHGEGREERQSDRRAVVGGEWGQAFVKKKKTNGKKEGVAWELW